MATSKKDIASALKKAGFNMHQVSVLSDDDDNGGYTLTIRRLEISKKQIEDAVRGLERLEYDHGDGDLLNCSTILRIEKDKKFSDKYEVSHDLIDTIDRALNDPNQDPHGYFCYYIMKNQEGDIELSSDPSFIPKEAALFCQFSTENGKDWLYKSIADVIFENILDRAYYLTEELNKNR